VIDTPHGKVTAYGGTVAAPIFKRIVEASLLHLGIGPNVNPAPPVILASRNTQPSSIRPAGGPVMSERVLEPSRDGLMPDLRGLSAREAVQSLTSLGLRARLTGSGSVVEQSIQPGSALVPGGGVLLKLGRGVAPVPPGSGDQ
jgi:hypothetical protein